MTRRVTAGVVAAAFFAAVFAASAVTVIYGAPYANGTPASLDAAQQYFNAGNYWTAIEALNAVVSRNPGSAEAYYWLGRNYFELRDFGNAITRAEKAVALDAKNSLYHQWLGRACGEQAERKKSFFLARRVKKEFEQAVLLDPSNISARRDLEEYCIEAPWIIGGSKDQAYAQVQAIAQLDSMEGHLARAAYYEGAASRPDLAEKEYRQVLASKPSNIEPYFEVMHFFQTRNQPADIQAAIGEAERVNSKDSRLAYYRGVSRVLSHSGLDQAEQDLESFLATSPDRSDWPPHASAREWLGRLYEAQGNRVAAVEQYRAALQLDPDRSELRARMRALE